MSRANPAKYVYRPVLLERPSMWRFILLSALLHIWLIVLFGDASGGRRDAAGWTRSFFATLEGAATLSRGISNTGSPRRPARDPQPGRPDSSSTPSFPAQPRPAAEAIAAASNVATNDVVTPAPVVASAGTPHLTPIEIEKIPVIGVEVNGAVTPFAVAPIVVEPLTAAASSVAPAIAPIPSLRSSEGPAVRAAEGGFAIYVPPIVERAGVVTAPAPVLATPTLPALAKPRIEREFATYVAPPVVPTAQAPAAALDATSMQLPTVSVPAAPAVQVAPPRPADVAPITTEPIPPLMLSPATKVLEAYQPRAVDATSQTPASSAPIAPNTPIAPIPPVAPAAPVARESAASAAQNAAQHAAAKTLGAASAAAPAAPSAGAGASTLLNAPLSLPSPPTTPAMPQTPASTSPNPPKLDLDQLRRQARDAARDTAGPRALLPFPMLAKEAPKKDMEKIFDKALKRPDCKEVYADLGLLAVVPLLRDAAKDGGCKW